MDSSPHNLAALIDRVGDMLTDSKHPMDDRAARELSLMLQQQTAISIQEMYAKVLQIQRAIADEKVDRETFELAVTKRLVDLENYQHDYPSMTWLFRHRTRETLVWSVSFIVLVMFIFLSYQEWLLNRLGLPPILVP